MEDWKKEDAREMDSFDTTADSDKINKTEIPTEVFTWFEEAEMLLIGIGTELVRTEETKDEVDACYQMIASFVKGKNYFVLTGNTDQKLLDGTIYHMLCAAPMVEGQEKQWNAYLNWLTCTLGHRIVLLELGEGFSNPQLMRWPFENLTRINQKAHLIRVGKMFSQIPKELDQKAISIKADACDFIKLLADWKANKKNA